MRILVTTHELLPELLGAVDQQAQVIAVVRLRPEVRPWRSRRRSRSVLPVACTRPGVRPMDGSARGQRRPRDGVGHGPTVSLPDPLSVHPGSGRRARARGDSGGRRVDEATVTAERCRLIRLSGWAGHPRQMAPGRRDLANPQEGSPSTCGAGAIHILALLPCIISWPTGSALEHHERIVPIGPELGSRPALPRGHVRVPPPGPGGEGPDRLERRVSLHRAV